MKKRFGISSGVIIVASFAAVLMATGAYGISKAKGALTEFACYSETNANGCTDGRALVGPRGVALSNEEGRFFVASYGSNAVAIFDRKKKKPNAGTLTQRPEFDIGCISEDGTGGQCIDGRALQGVRDVASADETVFWAAETSEAVGFAVRHKDEHYEQDSRTKACISDTGAGNCTNGRGLVGASSVEVPPGRDNVYVGGDHTIAIFAHDKGDDMLTQLNGTNGCINDDGTDGCLDAYVPGTVQDLWTVNNGRWVYAAVSGAPLDDGAVLIFSRDLATGRLTPAGCSNEGGTNGCTPASNMISPTGIMSDKGNGGGDNLYVAANGSNSVVEFQRVKSNGGLVQIGCINETGIGCTDGHNLIGAMRVNVYKTNQFAEVTSATGVASFTRDKQTGLLTQAAGANGCITETGDGGTCMDGNGLLGASGIVSSGGGKSVYVAGTNSDTVAEIFLDTNK